MATAGLLAQPELRALVPRGYAGYTEATAPRHMVLPATTAVPLIMKLRDSTYRPPEFVMGAHGSYAVMEGDCAPSYLEVWLAPLGAYSLLGLPMDEVSGLTVDLTDLLGAAGRRLGEQVRDAATWRQRFTLVDEFLLRRLERGPQPSPEAPSSWPSRRPRRSPIRPATCWARSRRRCSTTPSDLPCWPPSSPTSFNRRSSST
jgi:hypothetical protein